jgi:hypothetical protein
MAQKKVEVAEINTNSATETPEEVTVTKTVNPGIIALCNESLKTLAGVPKLAGQRDAIARATRIIEAIKTGATFETISAIFREGPTPMSFSGGGAWLPRELHVAAGRVVESGILIVKTSTSKGAYKTYADLAELVLAGEHISDDQPKYVGSYVKCWECGTVILVKEAAHQGVCQTCDSKRPKAGRAAGGVAITKMSPAQQKLYSFAKAALRHKSGAMATAMLAGLNTARDAAGLAEIGIDDFKAAKDHTDLMK